MYRFEISPVGLVVNVTTEITDADRASLEAAIALAGRDGGAFFVSLEACRSIDASAVAMFRDLRARYCDRLHVVVGDGSPAHDALRREAFARELVVVPSGAGACSEASEVPSAPATDAENCATSLGTPFPDGRADGARPLSVADRVRPTRMRRRWSPSRIRRVRPRSRRAP